MISKTLQLFDHIESEWPLGYIILLLDGIFKNNEEQVARYSELLEKRITRDENGYAIVRSSFNFS